MSRSNLADTPKLLASLGVAAGAIAASMPAEANVVIQTFNQDVGFQSGSATGSITVNLLSPFGFSFGTSSSGGNHNVYFQSFGNTGSAYTSVFGESHSGSWFAKPVPHGSAQDVTATSSNWYTNAYMFAVDSTLATNGPVASGPQYYLFNFDFPDVKYGWFYGSIVRNNFDSIYFHLQSVAYDTVPNEILPAGATSVPEPGSLELLALGAFVTGATATRRYKRARAA